MTGHVTDDREAVLAITVRGPSGAARDIETVIDTGFNGHLSLPPELVASLGLPFHSDGTATIADDIELTLPLYIGQVEWNGTERTVFVVAASGGALLGMSLLYGHRMCVDVLEAGRVTIEPIQHGPQP